MAISAQRFGSVTYTGDVSLTAPANAAANPASPGQTDPVALSTGDNVVPVPLGATGFVLEFPTGNAVLVKLNGLALHKTDPTSVGVDSSQASITLNAASPVTVRIYWA